MDESFERICRCVSPTLADAVRERFGELCEIRVRADKPIAVYLLARPHFITKSGALTEEYSDSLLTVPFADLKAAFARLCSYSVYKHIRGVVQGYITAEGGHRIGVCGTAVIRDRAASVTDITGLNIRAAKQFKGCSRIIAERFDLSKGALICGVPSSGKTTLLRDLARYLSETRLQKVCVIDERMELACVSGGRAGFDVGLSDVFSGYPKGEAMSIAVRTMSPQYIICDELTAQDVSAVEGALNCGVSVIASVHCGDLRSALSNATFSALVSAGAFRRLIFLGGSVPPTITETYDTEEITFDKAFRLAHDNLGFIGRRQLVHY